MKSRVLLLTCFGLAVLAGVTLFFQRPGSGFGKNTPDTFFPKFKPDELESIEFKNPKSEKNQSLEIRFRPEIGQWTVASLGPNPIDLGADVTKLLSLFDFMGEATVLQRVTQKKDAYSKFEIDDAQAATVTLKRKDSSVFKFYLGKTQNHSSQFTRKDGDPYVYLLSEDFSLSDLRPESWISKKILHYDLTELSHIRYRTKEGQELNLVLQPTVLKFHADKASTPPGKRAKTIDRISDIFREIHISSHEEIKSLPQTKARQTHALHFKDGSIVELRFLESAGSAKKAKDFFLKLTVTPSPQASPKVLYWKTVSERFGFKTTGFYENDYLKSKNDFFEDEPKEAQAPNQ